MPRKRRSDKVEVPGGPSMLDRLAYRAFMSLPETEKWNLSIDEWLSLDADFETKSTSYNIARNLIEELQQATSAMYEAGDAAHKHGPLVTVNIWRAITNRIMDK